MSPREPAKQDELADQILGAGDLPADWPSRKKVYLGLIRASSQAGAGCSVESAIGYIVTDAMSNLDCQRYLQVEEDIDSPCILAAIKDWLRYCVEFRP